MPHRGHAVPLVGRDGDLSRLRIALAESASGRGAAWLITGEAGIGKSRLVRELTTLARAGSALSLHGVCLDSTGESLPYGPFLQAFQRLRRAPPGSVSAGPVQELLDLLSGRHELQRDAVQFARYGRARVFDAADDALAALCAEAPVLLVLEDMHWADRSSVDLFGFLAGTLMDRRLLVVATYREDELPTAHPNQRSLLELSRQGLLNRLRLEALPESAMATLLARAAGPSGPAVTEDDIIARAEGNPFFALELLDAALEGRSTDPPETVREAVLIRLAVLPPRARDLVRLAAAAGNHVRHDTLLSASRSDGIDADIRKAVEANLMRIDQDAAGYAFRHALVRDVVYADLLPGERQELHVAIAEALTSAEHQGGEAGSAAEQAHHWRVGQRWPDAIRAGMRAGDAAALVYAYPEAAEQFERVLEMWFRATDPVAHAGCSRDEVVVRAAEAKRWAGHADQALALVRAALDEQESAGANSVLARLLERAGRYQWEMGDTALALRSYQLASTAAAEADSPTQLASVLAARAAGLIFLGRFEDSAAACDAALEAARRAEAQAVEAHVLATAGVAWAMTGRLSAGLEALNDSKSIAERVGDIEVLTRAYCNLSWVLDQAGRSREALGAAREGMQAMAQRGLLDTAGVPLVNNAASLLVLLGEWPEAKSLATDALTRPSMARFHALLRIMLAEVAGSQGAVAEADEHLLQARQHLQSQTEPQFLGPLFAVSAEALLWRHDPANGWQEVGRGLAAVEDSEHHEAVLRLLWLGVRCLADLFESAAATPGLDPLTEARRLQDKAGAVAEKIQASGVSLPQASAMAATLAAEVQRLRQDDDAGPWQRAAAAWDALGFPFPGSYARWRLAEALTAQRKLVAASAAWAEADATARALGALPLVDELQALQRRAGLRSVTSAPTASPSAATSPAPTLTAREREVLAALVDGRTNRQIGKRLFMSEKTVEMHVSRILAKLGVRNRLQAAAVAHRQGLIDEPEIPTG